MPPAAIGPMPAVRRRPARKAMLIALTCTALAATGAFAFTVGGGATIERGAPWRAPIPTTDGASRAALMALTPPDAPLPIPLDAAAGAARQANARMPFVPGALGSAAPFFIGADATDQFRAIDCLAAAAYYEAGTGASDQRAVIQVILNRLRHPSFPHTVCGVVFQGSDRTTGCQFTFTCDGAMARRQPSPLAWLQARQVALDALQGRLEPAVGLATHYHTDWVFPAWSGQMDKIAAIKTHLFFRWRGGPGNPGAFTVPYVGGEPRIAKMERLSAAHRGEGLPPATDMAMLQDLPATPLPTPAPAPVAPVRDGPPPGERLPDHFVAPDPDVFLVTLDRGAGPDAFVRLAEQACAGRTYCKFIGWTNPGRKAEHLPMPGSAIDAISFSFVRQGSSEPDRVRWNCSEFPRSDQSQCLRRGA